VISNSKLGFAASFPQTGGEYEKLSVRSQSVVSYHSLDVGRLAGFGRVSAAPGRAWRGFAEWLGDTRDDVGGDFGIA
jgi:hypothetical protein